MGSQGSALWDVVHGMEKIPQKDIDAIVHITLSKKIWISGFISERLCLAQCNSTAGAATTPAISPTSSAA